MLTVKVSRKNQITIPASVRRQHGIGPGDRLSVEVEDSRVILRPEPRSHLDRLINVAPELWRGIDVERYLSELRSEWSHREP